MQQYDNFVTVLLLNVLNQVLTQCYGGPGPPAPPHATALQPYHFSTRGGIVGCYPETLFSCTIAAQLCLFFYKGLVTLDEMKAKREVLVREHEKQLAAKLKSDEG